MSTKKTKPQPPKKTTRKVVKRKEKPPQKKREGFIRKTIEIPQKLHDEFLLKCCTPNDHDFVKRLRYLMRNDINLIK